MNKVILKKDGFWQSGWDSEKKEDVVTPLPTQSAIFLRGWNKTFEIEGEVTLLDLVMILRQMDKGVLSTVCHLVTSNVSGYLWEDMTPEPDDDGSELRFIEIYKYFELSNYSDVGTYDMEDRCVSAHGIGKPWEHGCEDVPLEKRGNSYAIEFTPWRKLLHLPLRLKEKTKVCKTTWTETEPRKQGFKKKGRDDFDEGLSWTIDRKFESQETCDVRVIYTMGEFFDGLFDELCFFWTPADRDEKMEDLIGRKEDIDEALADGSDNFSELVTEE